jgi:uncharacterized protein involved in exopolysaccharide biosynthesis
MAQIGETELDVRALSGALWRRAWLLVLVAAIIGAATYIGLGFVEPLYTADTKILIEERESPITRPRDQAAPASEFDESAIQSQVEVLKSREIADAVIDRLDLVNRPDFDPAARPSLADSLFVMLGWRSHPAEATIRQRVMDSYFDRLSVYPLANSRVIGLEFEAPDPQLAADVANGIAEAFVDLQRAAKRESAIAATDWLQQEIERLRARVAEAEAAVATYRASHDLFDVDQSANLSTQQLSDINAELARAKAARAEAEARAALIQSLISEGGALETSSEVLDSTLIQRLRERQVALRAQVAELSTTLLPGHPRLRSIMGQLQNLEAQIRQEAQKIQASLQTAARVAAAREQSLVESLNEAKVVASRSDGDEIELRALEREAAAQRDLLESFLARYREALARTDSNYLPADARIISRAIAPREPSYPKKSMMAAGAALAALLIASALLLLREFTSGRAFRIIDYGVSVEPARPPEPATTIVMPMLDSAPASQTTVLSITAPAAVAVAGPEPERYADDTAAAAVDEALEPEVGTGAEHDAGAARVSHAAAEAETDKEAGDADITLVGPEIDTVAVLVAGTGAEPGLDGVAEARTEAADHEPGDAGVAGESDLADEPGALAPALASAGDRPGTAELAEILASPAVRLVLFTGAQGGEGAGEIAFSCARQAAYDKLRFVLMDVGAVPSEALGGYEAPGLGDLLSGEAAFGEVIRRDDVSRLHTISVGTAEENAPLQRLQMVIGALTHTYDKVVVVADKLDDWPHEHVQPDLAAIVCGPETTELMRGELYDLALQRGARNVVIVRYTGDQDDGTSGRQESAAA